MLASEVLNQIISPDFTFIPQSDNYLLSARALSCTLSQLLTPMVKPNLAFAN